MLFPFGKEILFYAKSVSFWVNEWIFKYSDKIMSCKLWGKVTSVFLNINFCTKMSILGKNNWSSVRNVDFLKLLCTTYWKWISYWKTWSFSENCDFLCECLYTLRNCQNMIKTSIFLRKYLFVHVLILLKNCYFDSKYDFIRWYLDKSIIFLIKFTFHVA